MYTKKSLIILLVVGIFSAKSFATNADAKKEEIRQKVKAIVRQGKGAVEKAKEKFERTEAEASAKYHESLSKLQEQRCEAEEKARNLWGSAAGTLEKAKRKASGLWENIKDGVSEGLRKIGLAKEEKKGEAEAFIRNKTKGAQEAFDKVKKELKNSKGYQEYEKAKKEARNKWESLVNQGYSSDELFDSLDSDEQNEVEGWFD